MSWFLQAVFMGGGPCGWVSRKQPPRLSGGANGVCLHSSEGFIPEGTSVSTGPWEGAVGEMALRGEGAEAGPEPVLAQARLVGPRGVPRDLRATTIEQW